MERDKSYIVGTPTIRIHKLMSDCNYNLCKRKKPKAKWKRKSRSWYHQKKRERKNLES